MEPHTIPPGMLQESDFLTNSRASLSNCAGLSLCGLIRCRRQGCFNSVSAAILCGRDTELFVEDSAKVFQVRKTDRVGNLGNGLFGRFQKLARAFQAQ